MKHSHPGTFFEEIHIQDVKSFTDGWYNQFSTLGLPSPKLRPGPGLQLSWHLGPILTRAFLQRC